MMAVTNRTRYSAAAALMADREGADVLVVVARGAWRIARGAEPALAGEARPLVEADVYAGEPGHSSLIEVSDFVPCRPATDVVVKGEARAPGGRPVTSMTVEVEVGPLKRALAIHGDRVWRKSGLFGFKPGPAKPFTAMPLDWEHAFGGTVAGADGTVIARHEENPVGRGWVVDPKRADGIAMPNVEDPAAPLATPKDRPAPAGFGFVAPDWLPRRALAGTYDAAWEERRMPLLPGDFDDRFFNAAPAAMQASPHLEGGERVRLAGFDPAGEWRFRLPADTLTARLLFPADVVETHPLRLDAVVLEPGEERLQMVWRLTRPAPVPIARLLHVQIESAAHPAPVPLPVEAARV